MKILFNVDRATFVLGVTGVVALTINVTKNPWWIFGLFFMLIWVTLKEDNEDADGKERKGSSDRGNSCSCSRETIEKEKVQKDSGENDS